MTYNRRLVFDADEGYEAIILELIGKKDITGIDFNNLIKGLLWNAHKGARGRPLLISRKFSYVCSDAFDNFN